MNTKFYRMITLSLLASLISLSCLVSFGKDKGENNQTVSPSKNEETISNAEESGEDENEDSSGLEDYVYSEGGFQFTPIADWNILCAMGMIQMAAPDADSGTGPVFLIMAGDNETEMTTEEAFEKFKNESTATDIGKPKKVKVGGFPALQAEFTSQQGGQKIQAIAVTSMLTAKRQFTMMASSPEDRWEDDVEPYFKNVLNSIKFIDIVPGAGCPGEGSVEETATTDDELSIATGENLASDGLLHQWAVKATASSQYSDPDWAASQATGAPDVDECIDSVNAWASYSSTSKEWLELTYQTPVFPTEINVYMNYNPSQITEIWIIDTNGNAYTVVETYPEYVEFCPDVYQISLDLTKDILVNKVKIFIDQGVLGLGWNEIDAVELIGRPQDGAVLPNQPKPSAGSSQSGGAQSPYQPDELDPGAYAYDVTGYENDVVMGANVQYQSTSNSYVVGMISGTERYIVSLMLPKTGLKQGVNKMVPYDQQLANKGLTAAIYINSFLYIADSGEINILSDPSTGTLTATYYFKAHSKDFQDRSVEVAGALNQVLLK